MNRSDNQPNDDAEGYDLDHVLDDAFTSRRVPVLSPSMMDVRRRARRRTNRTRATGLAAVACVSVGGVALLANNHKPGSRPAVGAAAEVAAGYDEAVCATTTTWETLPATTLLAPETTWEVVPTTADLSAGFVGATTTTGFDVVTSSTDCLRQPPSGFRCIGDPTVTQDGWVYYDYCETIDTATPLAPTPTPTYTTVPWPTNSLLGEDGVYTVVVGDYLFDIAQRFCTTADFVAEYNGWPEGVNHPLNPGDLVKIPDLYKSAFCNPFATTTTVATAVDPNFTTTSNLPATTTTVGP